AIHAKGTVSFRGGAIGTIPAGNGIISQGINGVVGYVHAMSRDKNLENSVGAGLLGLGGGTSPGVFGSGQNGIVGYEQTTARDLAFEMAQKAGVLGRGETGVSGDGANGPGVFGRGFPVFAENQAAAQACWPKVRRVSTQPATTVQACRQLRRRSRRRSWNRQEWRSSGLFHCASRTRHRFRDQPPWNFWRRSCSTRSKEALRSPASGSARSASTRHRRIG